MIRQAPVGRRMLTSLWCEEDAAAVGVDGELLEEGAERAALSSPGVSPPICGTALRLAGDDGLEQGVLQLAEAADLDLAALQVVADAAEGELEAQAGQGGEQAALADHGGLLGVDADR
jgi:hypothetical protein